MSKSSHASSENWITDDDCTIDGLRRVEGPWEPHVSFTGDLLSAESWVMDWVGSVDSLGCSGLYLEFEDDACIRVILSSDIPRRASAIGILLTQHPECHRCVRVERTSPMKVVDDWMLATYFHVDDDDAFGEERVVAVTREPRKGRKLGLSEIFSHRVHGIDNTGNVRVWRAERALLHALLQKKQRDKLRGKRLLEIG